MAPFASMENSKEKHCQRRNIVIRKTKLVESTAKEKVEKGEKTPAKLPAR